MRDRIMKTKDEGKMASLYLILKHDSSSEFILRKSISAVFNKDYFLSSLHLVAHLSDEEIIAEHIRVLWRGKIPLIIIPPLLNKNSSVVQRRHTNSSTN